MMRRALVASVALALAACSSEPEDTKDDPGNNQAVNNAATNGATNGVPNGATNGATNGAAKSVFYYEDVKPIIDARCVACHTDGAIGPFPLGTYEEVLGVKELVQNSVATLAMPPFIYTSACREVEHDPSLTDEEIETITAWVDQGAPEGDPTAEGAALTIDLPEPPTFDTTLQMPEPYTPRNSPDDYRCFVLDWPYDEPRYITGFGVEPGEDAIVHHVVNFLASPESVAEAEALDAADEGPGYTCFGAAGISEQSWIGSWAPGGAPSKLEPGTGIRIEPGSKMIVQLHYNTLSADPIPDLTKVHYETANAVETEGHFIPWANPAWLSGPSMRITAGEADATHRFMLDPTLYYSNGRPITFYGGGLHMHLLGISATAWIQRADGTQDCLVETPRWDFSWQGGIGFSEPTTLYPGDKLALECHWDNSMANQPIVDGERIAPADVFWGEGTLEEMCLGVFYVTY